MIGPKHVPTHLEVVNFESDLTKHHQKLVQIHKANKNKEFLDQHAADKDRLYETRERGTKFHNSEKMLAIEKDNELLLGKLVEISRKKKTAADFKNDKHHVGTLNAPHRKREKDRIAAENEAFARRLLSQQPSFNRKKLENDYGKHNERVKQMQKVSMWSPRKIKLPPLKKEEDTLRKSKSGNALRDIKEVKKVEKKVKQQVNAQPQEQKEVQKVQQEKEEEEKPRQVEPERKEETPEKIERQASEKEVKEEKVAEPIKEELSPTRQSPMNIENQVQPQSQNQLQSPSQNNTQGQTPSQNQIQHPAETKGQEQTPSQNQVQPQSQAQIEKSPEEIIEGSNDK